MIFQVILLVSLATLTVAQLIAPVPVQVEPIVHFAPKPYNFGYDITDKYGKQYREEIGDEQGNVKGSYGFIDEKGQKRQVDYVADKDGFRVKIQTNEPGTANQDPADVFMLSEAPYAGGIGFGPYGVLAHEIPAYGALAYEGN